MQVRFQHMCIVKYHSSDSKVLTIEMNAGKHESRRVRLVVQLQIYGHSTNCSHQSRVAVSNKTGPAHRLPARASI